ncbi:MAG TPA: protoporphyrinogen oxidase [Longimicrobiales bacterium]|nr:protoporphyrinogen oxidase [Longimicrobiales bacterium]
MIVIIGGGISGLSLAHHLALSGREYVLLESSDRVGGVMRSGRVQGRLLEWGPQRTRLTREIASLIDELGLRDQLITAPPGLPLFVFARGQLRPVPFSPAAFLRTDIMSLRGKLRLLLEPLSSRARNDESVEALFTRKLGREAYETLAGPLYGGLYASEPHDMVVGLSLAHVLREFNVGRSMLLPLIRRGGTVAPPDACSFSDGMETLPRALHDRHASHIRLQTAVQALERTDEGYAVITDGGDRIEARDVVITTPAPAAASLLEHIAPASAARVRTLNYNPLTVVHLHAETDLRGLGYQVSLAEPLVTRGVTWNDSLFGRDGVYTAYLGGARNPWIAQETPTRAGQIAVTEFRLATGYDATVLCVEQERMPAWDRSWSAVQQLELPRGIHIHANWMSRPGIPGRMAGSRRIAALLADG